MVFFNYALRKLNAKIVYYGPGLCGKTTNLQWIHDHFEGGQRGKMISLSTEGDRTIFFDLLPLDIGSIRGMDVTLQLYTVPGQVHYNSTRQLVLRGADGVVFVADSQATMRSSNVESLHNLEENLSLQGVEFESFPHVLQFNKRDLSDLISIEDLDTDINLHSVPFFEAIATEGVGVQETLEGIVKLVMRNLRERYEPVVAAEPRPIGEGVPIDLEVPPPEPVIPVPPVAEQIPFTPRYEPPAMAEIPDEPVGLQDDIPTGVYVDGRPLSEDEDDRAVPGAAFWDEAEAASGPTFGESDSGFGADEPTGSSNFGFAMPFADKESTTDVTTVDDGDEQPDAEILSEPTPGVGAPDDADDEAVYRVPESPFEVADLTPAPFTSESVFGPPSDEGHPAAADEVESDVDEPAPAPVDAWFGDAAEVQAEGPSYEGGAAEGVGQAGTRSPVPGTVDDLVASVLRTADVDSITAESAEAAVVEDRGDGGWMDDSDEQAPDRQWVHGSFDEEGLSDEEGETPDSDRGVHDEEPPAEAIEEELEPTVDDGVEDSGWAAAEWEDDTPRVTADDDGAGWREEADDRVEADVPDDVEVEAGASVEEPLGPVEEAAPEPELTLPDDTTEAAASEDMGATEGEPADQWEEAHTDEIPVEAEAAEEAVHPPDEEPARPFSNGPFTFGDGDPFGDEIDDQATPVRAIVEPQVSVTAPVEVGQALIRPGDNQLHLRLQGTGAIAESGQVRALDIEVPVPGSWVGNRRVTLQLRLTLSPVPEDDDGGQGDAP